MKIYGILYECLKILEMKKRKTSNSQHNSLPKVEMYFSLFTSESPRKNIIRLKHENDEENH